MHEPISNARNGTQTHWYNPSIVYCLTAIDYNTLLKDIVKSEWEHIRIMTGWEMLISFVNTFIWLGQEEEKRKERERKARREAILIVLFLIAIVAVSYFYFFSK